MTQGGFKKRAASRIAWASLCFAAFAAPLAYYYARDLSEASVVEMAREEGARALAGGGIDQAAKAKGLAGGVFDIVEIYGKDGEKISEEMTEAGRRIEGALPGHGKPSQWKQKHYSEHLGNGDWVVRVIVTLPGGEGYFEGVRVVPKWQSDQAQRVGALAAILAALCALGCGFLVYPMVSRLANENAGKSKELLEAHIGLMESLGRAIAKRDSDTGDHNYRVAWMAVELGRALGLDKESMRSLVVGSFLHDVGKIGISDAILLKPGKLTPEEFEAMKKHVELGVEIVKGHGWLSGAAKVVGCHHEKWDGAGYPKGLMGMEIPMEARIFAVVDVYDALRSKRPYKDPFVKEKAMDMLMAGSGSHFDPQCVVAFKAMSERLDDAMYGQGSAGAKDRMQEAAREIFETE